MKPRPAILKSRTSSGGVIFRSGEGSSYDVALVSVRGGTVWSLPKGLVDRGESLEDTAQREVAEETGLRGRLLDKIGQTSYWYYIKGENVKCKKTVHYYLLKYLSGSTDGHDSEVDDAMWVKLKDAEGMLSYRGDKMIMRKAVAMLRDLKS